MEKLTVTSLLVVVVAVLSVHSAIEMKSANPLVNQTASPKVANKVTILKPLVVEIMARDKNLRSVLNRLNDVFEPAVLSGKETTDINWRQMIEDAVRDVRAIDVSTPVKQAVKWINDQEYVIPFGNKKSVIEYEHVKYVLTKYMEMAKRMTDAPVALSKAETRGSTDRILRLASIFYHSLGWEFVTEDVDEKNDSAMLQEALDIVSENQTYFLPQ